MKLLPSTMLPSNVSHTLAMALQETASNLTTASGALSSPMQATTDGLSEEEKAKQRTFLIAVVTCFFSFLFILVSYVVYTQVKRYEEAVARQKRDSEEVVGQPNISRKTSVVGQGQKMLIIERKASASGAGRKASQTSQNSCQGNNKPKPPYRLPSLCEEGKHGKNGISKQDVFMNPSSPLGYGVYPPNTYLDNLIVRYRDSNAVPCSQTCNCGNSNYLTKALNEKKLLKESVTEEEEEEEDSDEVKEEMEDEEDNEGDNVFPISSDSEGTNTQESSHLLP